MNLLLDKLSSSCCSMNYPPTTHVILGETEISDTKSEMKICGAGAAALRSILQLGYMNFLADKNMLFGIAAGVRRG